MTDAPHDPEEPVHLTIDPERKKLYGDMASGTGIFIRARFDGRWGNHDIAHLDKISLIAWLRSRGGDNPWAESVVCILLGHKG